MKLIYQSGIKFYLLYNLCDLMVFFKYYSLLEIKEISKICSKPYGFELLILIYNQTKNNADIGVEETYNKLMFNKSQRPAFINFINELEHKGIILRHISTTKKSKVLLRLSVSLMNKIDQILEINR
jgi:hypothetical protein